MSIKKLKIMTNKNLKDNFWKEALVSTYQAPKIKNQPLRQLNKIKIKKFNKLLITVDLVIKKKIKLQLKEMSLKIESLVKETQLILINLLPNSSLNRISMTPIKILFTNKNMNQQKEVSLLKTNDLEFKAKVQISLQKIPNNKLMSLKWTNQAFKIKVQPIKRKMFSKTAALQIKMNKIIHKMIKNTKAAEQIISWKIILLEMETTIKIWIHTNLIKNLTCFPDKRSKK